MLNSKVEKKRGMYGHKRKTERKYNKLVSI